MSSGERDKGGFSDLFKGAASVGLLFGALSLDWTKVAPFVSAFGVELNKDLEIGVSSEENSVSLGTRGEGQDFVHRVARFMESDGVSEGDLKQFLVRAAFTNYQNVFFSMEVFAEKPSRFNYVLRSNQPLDVGAAMLVDADVDAEGLAFFRDASRTLEKEQIHAFLGAYTRDGVGVQAPIFSQPSELESWVRWKRFLDAGGLEISPAELEVFQRLTTKGFMAGPCYDSASNSPGALCFLSDVEPKDLETMGFDSATLERVETLLRVSGRRRLSRLEWKVSGPGDSSIRFYCG